MIDPEGWYIGPLETPMDPVPRDGESYEEAVARQRKIFQRALRYLLNDYPDADDVHALRVNWGIDDDTLEEKEDSANSV